ncbi:MAG: hypothetical protein HOP13_12340 [Alphaproteobacteria bacterium]|nr:hypothetical protein [Alphaproteobacteria bacterium]
MLGKFLYVFGPEGVRASVLAYDSVLRALGYGPSREAVPDNVRRTITSSILTLADSGVRDPERLTRRALARLRKANRRRVPARFALKSQRSA